jgi:hypothetical protein
VLKGEPRTPEFLGSYQAATAKRKRDSERVTEGPVVFWRDPRSRKKLRRFRDALAVSSPRQADYM